MKKLQILIFVLIIIIGCRRENNETLPLKKSLPYELGNTWIYLNYNSQTKLFDTLRESIVGNTILDDSVPVIKLLYKYSNIIDTNYLYVSKDTIKIYESIYHNTSLFGYVFPLKVGKVWTGFNNSMRWDSTIVIKELEIEVFPNVFYKGFELNKKGWIFEGGYDFVEWYVPGIGVVETFKSKSSVNTYDNIQTKLIQINFIPIDTTKVQ